MMSSKRLPDEIVFDILTRVPVKSIIRFRCVSKSLNTTITNPIFITAHLNQAKSSSSNNNHNGYLLYVLESELCTAICNSDYTFTQISSFEMSFYTVDVLIDGYCNGIFCIRNNYEFYLWNPSIKKLKIISIARFSMPLPKYTLGLAYHSQNNDFKVLKIASYRPVHPPVAEVYTLSTDSWRRVEIPIESLNEPRPNGCFSYMISSPCLFFHGALHAIVETSDVKFILAFDVNDEIFREIMLPQNLLDGVDSYHHLTVFKGSLALFASGEALDEWDEEYQISVIWVMREYGVIESWTKISGPVIWVESFFGCTNNGELLIATTDDLLISFDPESLNKNDFGIPNTLWVDRILDSTWMDYTTNFVESLVLLDGIDE
uniref:F-box domain-containing protein n=2 Tax=Fagus sylvatica TaxID=28930 RepID=A0A2N9GJL4_FAGSY